VYVAKVIQTLVNEEDQQKKHFIDLHDLIQHYAPSIKKYLDDILIKGGGNFEVGRSWSLVDRFKELEVIIDFLQHIKKGKIKDLGEMCFMMDSIRTNPTFRALLSSEKKQSRKKVRATRAASFDSFANLNDVPTAIPKGVMSSWGRKGVCQWLKSLGLGQYSKMFYSHSINGALLEHLTTASLLELGITNLSHRKKLTKEKDKLLEDEKLKDHNLIYLWTVEDVSSWCRAIPGCKKFYENVLKEKIGGIDLCVLGSKELLGLGVTHIKTRKLLTEQVIKLRAKAIMYLGQKDIASWNHMDLAGLFAIKQRLKVAKQIERVKLSGPDVITLSQKQLQTYGFSTRQLVIFFTEIAQFKQEGGAKKSKSAERMKTKCFYYREILSTSL